MRKLTRAEWEKAMSLVRQMQAKGKERDRLLGELLRALKREEPPKEPAGADWPLRCKRCHTGHEQVDGEVWWRCECCGQSNRITDTAGPGA